MTKVGSEHPQYEYVNFYPLVGKRQSVDSVSNKVKELVDNLGHSIVKDSTQFAKFSAFALYWISGFVS